MEEAKGEGVEADEEVAAGGAGLSVVVAARREAREGTVETGPPATAPRGSEAERDRAGGLEVAAVAREVAAGARSGDLRMGCRAACAHLLER